MRTKWLFVLAILGASMAIAHQSKVAPDLQGADPGQTTNVIVQYRAGFTEAHHQKLQAGRGVLKSTLDVVNAAAVSVPLDALPSLLEDPDVIYVSPDRPVQAFLDNADYAVNAGIAWQYGWDGSKVGIAVIDSGISSHPDLMDASGKISRVVYNQSFIDATVSDPYGHGTHVAGAIAGNGISSSKDSRVFRGIAPDARLINLRVLDKNGYGTDSAVIAAIQRAIQLKNTYNIRIINLSLGRPVYDSYVNDPLCQAVEAAWKAGIVVVVAAGNDGRNNSAGTDGYATITSPGNDPYAITVGAMKTLGTGPRGDDLAGSYSSKGPTLLDHIVKPDIVAPGNRMISLAARNSVLNTLNNRYSSWYCWLSGTSQASAIVSGAAAVLLDKEPSLTPDGVKARLMKTATKEFPSYSVAVDPSTNLSYRSQYDIFTIGAGYLDLLGAISNSDVANAPALSPKATYDAKSGNVYLVTDSSAVWGTSALWGTSAVWGTYAFVSGTSALWGTSAVWGTTTTSGFSALWGTSAVWGTTTQTSSETSTIALVGEN